MLYLDAAATSPVRREALEAMWPYLTGDFGNPSSRHTVGESAARGLATARERVAAFLGCRPGEVVFTGSGTEADNLAVKGIALANARGRHIVTSRIEHEAVLESVDALVRLHGFDVTFVSLDAAGLVTPDALAVAVRPDTTLVSLAHGNNEIGTVHDLAALADVTRPLGIPFHTDAVQTAGWLPIGVGDLGVDALSLAGHKLGAPKGIGALFVAGRIPLEPLVHGGGQERGRRSGTENVAGAVALGVAVTLAAESRAARAAAAATARDGFIADVLGSVPGSRLTGPADPSRRLPAHASFVFPGTHGESILLELERRGVVSSSGSACSAGSDEPSHVLTALGITADIAQTAVRFTWQSDVTTSQLGEVAAAVRESVDAVGSLH
jgi:cysteine desulfurase